MDGATNLAPVIANRIGEYGACSVEGGTRNRAGNGVKCWRMDRLVSLGFWGEIEDFVVHFLDGSDYLYPRN